MPKPGRSRRAAGCLRGSGSSARAPSQISRSGGYNARSSPIPLRVSRTGPTGTQGSAAPALDARPAHIGEGRGPVLRWLPQSRAAAAGPAGARGAEGIELHLRQSRASSRPNGSASWDRRASGQRFRRRAGCRSAHRLRAALPPLSRRWRPARSAITAGRLPAHSPRRARDRCPCRATRQPVSAPPPTRSTRAGLAAGSTSRRHNCWTTSASTSSRASGPRPPTYYSLSHVLPDGLLHLRERAVGDHRGHLAAWRGRRRSVLGCAASRRGCLTLGVAFAPSAHRGIQRNRTSLRVSTTITPTQAASTTLFPAIPRPLPASAGTLASTMHSGTCTMKT